MLYYDSQNLVVQKVMKDTKREKINLLLRKISENIDFDDEEVDFVFGVPILPFLTEEQTKFFDEIVELELQHYLSRLLNEDNVGNHYTDIEIIKNLKLHIGVELYHRLFLLQTNAYAPITVESIFSTNYEKYLDEYYENEKVKKDIEERTSELDIQLALIEKSVIDFLPKSLKMTFKSFKKMFSNDKFMMNTLQKMDTSNIYTVRIFETDMTIVGDFNSTQVDADLCYIVGDVIVTQSLLVEKNLIVRGNIKANALKVNGGKQFFTFGDIYLLSGLYLENADLQHRQLIGILGEVSTPLVFSAVENSQITVKSFVDQPTYVLGYAAPNRLGEETLLEHPIKNRILVSQLNFEQKNVDFRDSSSVINSLIES